MNLRYGSVISFIGEATKKLLPFTQITHTDTIVQNVNMNTMNNEYVIINKTAIQKIIEKLNKEIIGSISNEQKMLLTHELDILKIIISNSTPLIPEIEKAFDAGGVYCFNVNIDKKYDGDKQEYISNLKLDI